MEKVLPAGLGQYKKQKITKSTPNGFIIAVAEGNAFLPDIENDFSEETEIEMFIYHDYGGNLTASLTKPLIEIEQVKVLRIKATGDKGAFADWGLEKDLFIPHAEQHIPLEKGASYPVYAYIDKVSGRITGSTQIDKHFPETITEKLYEAGNEVNVVILKKTDLGFKALIDDQHIGLLYENELTQPVKPGDCLTAYIKTHREDGKIDLSLRKPGYNEILQARECLLDTLTSDGGYLAYNDKSNPDEIRKKFGMSKRTFKAAVGSLLKENLIQFSDNGIKLKEDDVPKGDS